MARKPRIAIPDYTHHVTQHGNRRQAIFFLDEDRDYYLDLLGFYLRKFEVFLLSYCLMTNHVHLLMIPQTEDGLSKVMQAVHMRYAKYINQRHNWRGHLWQERFYASPLDTEYFWICLRYIERNPVEIGLVMHAAEYRWSSAAAHCELRDDVTLYYPQHWKEKLTEKTTWHQWLGEKDSDQQLQHLRDCTQRYLPCGSPFFLDQLTTTLGHPVQRRSVGRPRKTTSDPM